MILAHADSGDAVAVLAALALFWAMWRTRRPRPTSISYVKHRRPAVFCVRERRRSGEAEASDPGDEELLGQ